MLILVVSDFHLGKGRFLHNGQLNILEDFCEDERFVEFLEYYGSGKYYWSNVHLVLNGDMLNLVQVDVDGVFTHIIDESTTVRAIDSVVSGHKSIFDALRLFLSRPNKKITYIIGNHDPGMAFPGAKKRFSEIVGEKVEYSFSLDISGIHIEHGHRFEVVNLVPEDKYFMEGPNGKQILNLPWATLFCIVLLPILRKERPHIDKIRPLSMYLKWCLVHDTFFAIRLIGLILKYFVKTNFKTYTKLNSNFKTTLKLLKQITIYPKFGKMAKKILKADPNCHTVVMGHTHIVEWRKFPENKYYFNSGTWNVISSLDVALHENQKNLTYVSIDLHVKTGIVRDASVKSWMGKWRPFRQEVKMSLG